MEAPRFYRRNLPHMQPDGPAFSVVFRLQNSLPKSVIFSLQEEKSRCTKQIRTLLHAKYEAQGLSIESTDFQKDLKLHLQQQESLYFGRFDSLLDNPASGPTWLSKPEVAQIVQKSIHFIEDEMRLYKVACYCIMSNHVHLIVYETEKVLHQILRSLKRHTSRKCNLYLGRMGEFWQKESYDRIMRDELELFQHIHYVLNNPVKAGLVNHWDEWQFSYVRDEFKSIYM